VLYGFERRGVWVVPTHDCGTGKSESLFRTDDVDDTCREHTNRSTG
jgi:hypothetical protein